MTPDELKEKIDRFLKPLTDGERKVFKLCNGLFDGFIYTPEEVGRFFKITPDDVRRIEDEAVEKLKKAALLNPPEEWEPTDHARDRR